MRMPIALVINAAFFFQPLQAAPPTSPVPIMKKVSDECHMELTK